MGYLWILLALSVPLFYVLGLVSFIKTITGKDAPKEKSSEDKTETYLKTAISELSNIIQNQPNKKLSELLSDYKKDLATRIGTLDETLEEEQPTTESVPTKPPSSLLNAPVSSFWDNWYSHNSINLLLYVGAFLIVSSAGIFVGFAWETIPGVLKAAMLSLLTAAFFLCGFWFYGIPKIKNAGFTFIAIGALLLPLCGAAWYNFVFQEAGYSAGPIWMATSLVSLVLYIYLAYIFKNSFYAYVASAASLSLSFSLVNVMSLDSNFYILAALITSYVLLLTKHFSRSSQPVETFNMPLEISSNIVVPLSLGYGLIVAFSDSFLFSIEAVSSLLLGIAFYLTSYYFDKKPWKIAVSFIIIPLYIIVFNGWLHIPEIYTYYIISFLGLIYIGISSLFSESQQREEKDITMTLGIIASIFPFFIGILTGIGSTHIGVLSIVPIAAGVLMSYVKKRIEFVGISSFFLGISCFVFHYFVFHLGEYPQYLAITYVLIGSIFYLGVLSFSEKKDHVETFAASSVYFFVASIIASYSDIGILTIICIIVSMLFFHAFVKFRQQELLYGTTVFITATLLFGLLKFDISSTYFSLFFTGLAVLFYAIHLMLPPDYKKVFKESGLAIGFLSPVLFGLYDITNNFSYVSNSSLSHSSGLTYSLYTGYVATGLFALEAYLYKRRSIGYFASAIGLGTFLWQLVDLSVTQTLFYTIPTGLYFIALSTFLKEDKSENYSFFEVLGVLFLTIPPLYLSFGTNGALYQVVLGGIGILLLGAGISLAHKIYRNSGIAAIILAILPQTYQFISGLPKWLIVGGVGFVFIIVAIYLLMNRKEDQH